jgi:hypothetical protein
MRCPHNGPLRAPSDRAEYCEATTTTHSAFSIAAAMAANRCCTDAQLPAVEPHIDRSLGEVFIDLIDEQRVSPGVAQQNSVVGLQVVSLDGAPNSGHNTAVGEIDDLSTVASMERPVDMPGAGKRVLGVGIDGAIGARPKAHCDGPDFVPPSSP